MPFLLTTEGLAMSRGLGCRKALYWDQSWSGPAISGPEEEDADPDAAGADPEEEDADPDAAGACS